MRDELGVEAFRHQKQNNALWRPSLLGWRPSLVGWRSFFCTELVLPITMPSLRLRSFFLDMVFFEQEHFVEMSILIACAVVGVVTSATVFLSD